MNCESMLEVLGGLVGLPSSCSCRAIPTAAEGEGCRESAWNPCGDTVSKYRDRFSAFVRVNVQVPGM